MVRGLLAENSGNLRLYLMNLSIMAFRLHALLFFVLLGLPFFGKAQIDSVWTLRQSILYAQRHNISIQQSVLNERLAALRLQQARLSQLPSVNINSNYGTSRGRSVDPTTNMFVEGVSYNFLSLSGTADVILFGWFQKRHQIAENQWQQRASEADLDQARDDVSLNVAAGYLRALLAREQARVSREQVRLSEAQLEQTRQFARAGRVPELDVAQMESQLASDSANLIGAIMDYENAILDIKALLNLDFSTPYVLEVSEVSLTDQLNLLALTPEQVFAEASRHMGSVQAAHNRMMAARKGFEASRARRWPTLSLSAQIGTNYASTVQDIQSITPTGEWIPTPYFVRGVDSLRPVWQPGTEIQYANRPLRLQFEDNFRQTIALQLSIPLFNGWQAEQAVRQAKIQLANEELQRSQAVLNLKQNVYKAYSDARNAISKYQAAKRAAEAAQRALDFAQKRYEVGLTNTVEYLTARTTQYQAASQLASSKFDLLFKLKVVDYYMGKEIKI